jgi:hypothetical protein
MKRGLPVLAILLELGSVISSAQTKQAQKYSDPYERYLNGVGSSHREPSLRRFASACGVDVASVKAKYAVTAGNDWRQVKNLRHGLKSLESDFYATIEVWKSGSNVLVEMWPNSDDVGSEVRILYCFASDELRLAETIQWNVPVMQNPEIRPWGYSRHWRRDAQGSWKQADAAFVDEHEQIIPKPKLDADDEESLRWSPSFKPLSNLKLPKSMLQ